MATYLIHETTAPLDSPSPGECAMGQVTRYYYDDIGHEVVIRRFHQAGGRSHFQNEERIPVEHAPHDIRWRIKSRHGVVPSPEDLYRTRERIARTVLQLTSLILDAAARLAGRRGSLVSARRSSVPTGTGTPSP